MAILKDDQEAKSRYKIYEFEDPFPNIKPALLNSTDIKNYIIKTGMVCPFDSNNLKTASYEVCFEGKVYSWGENDEPKIIDLDKNNEFYLEKNSIAFLFTKTKFRIPYYIALRFNLTITNVHRGILLGTGPLVDPGFEGNLLIPLHNLTTNRYKFTKGEGIIWVEFTKLSEHKKSDKYIKFPPGKKNLGAEYYFGAAAWGRSIRSSIPDAMRKSEKSAKKAAVSSHKAAQEAEAARKEAVKMELEAKDRDKNLEKAFKEKLAKVNETSREFEKKITRRSYLAIIVGFLTLFVSLYWGLVQIHQLVEDTNYFLSSSTKDVTKLRNEEALRIELLDKRIDSLEKILKNKSK